MKTSFLCLSLLLPTVSTVSLRLDPDLDQFFSFETIKLSCDGGWTVKRTTEGHSQIQSCDGEQDFKKINDSSCVLEYPGPSDSGTYWCESGSGARGPQRPLSVTGGGLILESPGLPVEAGSDVTLRCRTRPGSKLNPEIHKDGSVIRSRPEWTITDVSKLHEGLYSCSALEEGAAVRSAERELRVKDPPTTVAHPSTSVPPSTTLAPSSPEASPESSPEFSPESSPESSPELSVQWVLLRLLVGSPYCVCTVLLVWIYSDQRGTGSPRVVSMETGQDEEGYDDVDAEVTNEYHF